MIISLCKRVVGIVVCGACSSARQTQEPRTLYDNLPPGQARMVMTALPVPRVHWPTLFQQERAASR